MELYTPLEYINKAANLEAVVDEILVQLITPAAEVLLQLPTFNFQCIEEILTFFPKDFLEKIPFKDIC